MSKNCRKFNCHLHWGSVCDPIGTLLVTPKAYVTPNISGLLYVLYHATSVRSTPHHSKALCKNMPPSEVQYDALLDQV